MPEGKHNSINHNAVLELLPTKEFVFYGVTFDFADSAHF